MYPQGVPLGSFCETLHWSMYNAAYTKRQKGPRRIVRTLGDVPFCFFKFF